jgi:hypothetical protein
MMNHDLIKTFFRYYCSSLIEGNERLNSSYLEKLRSQYQSMQCLYIRDLEKAFGDFCHDIEMHCDDEDVKSHCITSVMDLINKNTNYTVSF